MIILLFVYWIVGLFFAELNLPTSYRGTPSYYVGYAVLWPLFVAALLFCKILKFSGSKQ